MSLPAYFLADLPAEAALTPAMLTEACQTLKRNRAQYLSKRATVEVIGTIEGVAKQWLRPDFPIRKLALERGPSELHFSRATLTRGLDDFFGQLHGESLEALVKAELGHSNRLDDFVADQQQACSERSALARGPEFLVHITADPNLAACAQRLT